MEGFETLKPTGLVVSAGDRMLTGALPFEVAGHSPRTLQAQIRSRFEVARVRLDTSTGGHPRQLSRVRCSRRYGPGLKYVREPRTAQI